MVKKSQILILALLTLLLFPLIGLTLINLFSDQNFNDVLIMNDSIVVQIIKGSLYGLATSFMAILLFKWNFLKTELEKYQNMLTGMNLNFPDILFISLCAGIGEELLFRAAIQPLLGIGITSILFVALHGYLNPYNIRISVYGLYLTLVILGIAYFYSVSGILTAISAHTVIDIVLLFHLTRRTN